MYTNINYFIQMYTFIGAPNPTPTLHLPTSEQYKMSNRQI